jgi:hypothetical protein
MYSNILFFCHFHWQLVNMRGGRVRSLRQGAQFWSSTIAMIHNMACDLVLVS